MATTAKTYVPRLKSKYKEEIRSNLKEKFQYKSVMQVPKLEKIAINQGCLLYTSPSPRDRQKSRMPSSA